MMPQENTTPNPLTDNPSLPAQFAKGNWIGSALPFLGLALLFVALVIGGGYLTIRGGLHSRNGGGAEEQELQPGSEGLDNLSKWDKPAAALIVSGQMHGYFDPCGCSIPQQGGLTRRYNFIQSLKEKGWDVVGIDLGELPQIKGIPEQNWLKYKLSMNALATMGYKAVGIGRNEILLPLGEGLAPVWDEKNPYPRPISVTLAATAPGQKYYELNVRPFEIIDTPQLKIGVVNMMGPDLRKEFQDRERFLNNLQELPRALQAFANAGVQIGVILHHEYPQLDAKKFPAGGIARLKAVEKERAEQAALCAKFCAEARARNPRIPPIQLMMILADESEPPSLTRQLFDDADKPLPTQVVEIGHKGKYVGVVGVYPHKDGSYQLRYQTVLMSPEWETPAVKKKDHPVIALAQHYNDELKKANMLAKVVRSPHYNQIGQNQKGLKATYVGSNRCKNCHEDAFKTWQNSKHSHGTEMLENLKFPSGRQYDPECMKCHTTGLEHPGGYNDLVEDLAAWTPGKKANVAPEVLQAHNKKLRGIGCESCHGPASAHVKNPDDLDIRKLINPYRPSADERKLEGVKNAQFKQLFQARLEHLNRFCIQCHDSENDVHWNNAGIVAKWIGGNIVHRKGLNNNGAVQPAPKGAEPAPIVIEVK